MKNGSWGTKNLALFILYKPQYAHNIWIDIQNICDINISWRMIRKLDANKSSLAGQ